MHFGGGFGGGGGWGFRYRGMSEEEKAKMPKITKELVFRAFKYLVPYWKQQSVIVATITISAVMGLLPPIITGKIIDDGFNGGDFTALWQLIVASFSVFIASNLIGVLESYVSTWVSAHIGFDLRNEMYRHLEFMSHKFYTTEKQGDIITRMTGDIGGVQGAISGVPTSIYSQVITLATTIFALYSKNWILATIGIVLVPLFILPTKKVGKKRFEFATETQKKNDEMNQILSESLSVSGSLLVKIFTKEDDEYDRYKKTNGEITQLNIKENIVGRWFRMTIGIFTNMGPMLIYLTAGILMFKYGNTKLTIGDVTVMVTLINRLYGPVNSLFNMQVDITRSMAYCKRVFDYFDMPHEVENKPDAIMLNDISGDIEFENVDFHYSEDLPILKKVSFAVPKGSTVAVVGPSGAGKSTLINLIPRLYDAVGGCVKIDGLDIKEADMFSLRRHIGFVTQDTYLFNGTVKANLLYANEKATDGELADACKKANIHDYIDSLPEKYETIVGNRGLKLSGGEKQRLSIARAILKDPKILLLDEATSSLDSISESLIQQAVDPLLENRTSVVIAHRLSTVMAADEIIVLDKGEIAQRGKHAELLQNDGVYKELYETQFRRAIEDTREREKI
ncbi:MAG: ABC transporter ATP-binding protein/permease [Oscillospiraceae bacterium]|jgi:ATP-binding cassette subfamily B protein|nr:ABC transporter ATP-binding protein/permease [Oscillospiraceae bacterium]